MNYFHHLIMSHGTQVQIILFAGLFFISWNIENISGVIFNYKKWKHALVNAPFIFTNIPGQLLLGVAFANIIEWTTLHHFGFLYLLPQSKSPFLLFIATFVSLDFGEYIYHVIMHKVKALWMFHSVHHSDNVVDVSTTFREHPGENIIRLSITLLWVFLSGAVFWALILRQIIQVFTTLFAHINYVLPNKVDSLLGLVFITPNLHHVHHHYQKPYTDSNYGDVLGIWDRMFGTFKKLNSKELVYGLDTCMEKKDNSDFKSLIKIPYSVKGRRKKV